jgi:VanZ family protein
MLFAELRRPIDSNQALKSALLVGVILLFNSFDSNDRFNTALKNWGHVAVFFLGAHLLLDLLRRWIGQQALRLIGVALFCLGVGAAVEVIQPYFGRDRSLLDLIYDGVGISAALLWYLAYQGRKKWLHALGMAVLAVSTMQPVYYGVMILARTQAAPYLAGFEQFWEQDIWRAAKNTSARVETNPTGGHWLRVEMTPGAYPGVSFPEIHHDWQSYSALALRVFSSQPQPVKLTLRIHDAQHNNDYNDRFNQSLALQPGINDLVIDLNTVANAPKNRQMDLSEIQGLMLFAVTPEQPLTIFVDDLRLISDAR